jgi:glycosyltransferase involved in cell wall biosynthesis
MSAIVLSVIVPAYNHAHHLPGCLGSILGSGVDGVEVIIVDDGSTDETASVVERFGDRVRYLRQENAGPAVARNRGFAESSGRYVTFLDSDDHLVPGGLARLCGVLDRHPENPLVFADTWMGTFAGGFESFIGKFGGAAFEALPVEPIEPGVVRLERGPFFRRLSRRNVVFLGSLVLRREVFAESKGFDRSLVGAADWEFFMRLASRVAFTCDRREPASYYLQSSSSMSKNQDHMELEFAGALRRVLAQPLSVEDRRWIARRLAEQEFGYAYQLYDRGEWAVAREHFGLGLAARPDLKGLAFWLASHLPPKVVGSARNWKRGITG